jgi:hypothetical protein
LHSANLVDERTYRGSGRYWTGAITLIKSASDGTSQDRVRAAATALEQLQQGYDLYAFTNLADSVGRGGAMCSGSVLDAWQRSDSGAGGFRWNGAATKFYSGAYRAPRATYIYDLLYEMAYPVAHDRQDCSAGAIATGIAKQFVNGFASGPYTQNGVPYKDLFTGINCYAWTPLDLAAGTFEWERTTCWNANSFPAPVGDGNTASPDDLMERIQAGATSYSAVGTTPTLVPGVTTCTLVPNPEYPACSRQ